ncbi:MAG: right-handed parallel beta-helix repeat-containing protein [Chloroflexota bacterium]|nr:right-handed parallel beta-helix repeat-containing protein [Chloroflexota bacterium]
MKLTANNGLRTILRTRWLFTLIFLFGVSYAALALQPTIAHAAASTTYYVSNKGNDAHPGTNKKKPWRSLAKVNSIRLNPGDRVLLERGGVWNEELIISSSGTAGSPVYFGTYGNGLNPLIVRTEPFTQWSLYYDDGVKKIWQGSVDLAGKRVRGLIEDGQRITYLYIPNHTAPEAHLANNTFGPSNQPGDYRFFLRKDSGPPGSTLIGVRSHAIYVAGQSYVTIDGIDGYGPGATKSSLDQSAIIYTTEGSSHITLQNLTVSFSHEQGIADGYWRNASSGLPAGGVGATGLYYSNITSHDNMAGGIYLRGSGTIMGCASYNNGLNLYDTGDKNGVNIQGGPTHVEGCHLYQLGNPASTLESDFAIEVNNPVGSVTLVRNHIHDVAGGGIQVSSETSNYASNHLIAYNIIHRFGPADYANTTAGKLSGVRLQRADDVKVHNNVIAYGGASKLTRGLFVRYHSRNLSLKNNIFYHNANSDLYVYPETILDGFSANHNLYYKANFTDNWNFLGTRYSLLALWQLGTIQDLNSLDRDPQLIQSTPSSADGFKLQSTSPAINAGIDVGLTQDFAGSPVTIANPPDMGSWEYY